MKLSRVSSLVVQYTGLLLAAVGVFLYLGGVFQVGKDFRVIVFILTLAAMFVGGALALLGMYRGDVAQSKQKVIEFLKGMSAPAVGIVLSLLIGAIVMLIAGYNPIQGYGAMFYGGFVRNWSITVLNAVPLIFTGLAVAFAFRAGLLNIGAEGQYYIGAMAAAALGIYFNLPGIIAIPLIFIIGGLLSSLYVLIPAILKIRTGAHEIITTMMFAQIASLLSPLMVRNFGGHTTSAHPLVTDEILPQLFLPLFSTVLPQAYYRLHTGILIAIGAALLVHYILWKTPIGFEIRAVGQNRHAAKVQGVSIAKVYIVALLGSGFLAGTAGITQVLGFDHKLFENISVGYGWNGISVALLAANKPIVVIFTALLWAALDSGGQYMQRTVEIPSSVVEIIKGVVLFLLVVRSLYVNFYKKWRKNMSDKNASVDKMTEAGIVSEDVTGDTM